MKTSKSLKIRDLSFKFIPSDNPAMGLIVSKKYGNSVQRNLFKRRCRSIFKKIVIDNNLLYSVIVQPKKQSISFQSINESFSFLHDKLRD